jgi:hypothetical protein
MTSAYTASLQVEKPGNGDQPATWGLTANQSYDLLDAAIAGVATIVLTTSQTLPISQGTSSPGRSAVLVFSGTPAADCTVTLDAKTKSYLARNTTAKNVILTTGGGSSVTIPAGLSMLVYCDGTNVVKMTGSYNPATDAISATTFLGNITGNVTGNVTGNLTGNVVAAAGSAAAASVQVGATVNGLYSPGANQLGFTTGGTNAGTFDASGNLTVRGNVTWSSDIRLKRDIRPANVGLAQALRMRPATWLRHDGPRRQRRQLGLIAQEAKSAHPLAVITSGDGMLAISAAGINAILLGAIHDLSEELDAVKARLRAVERRHG